MKAWRASTADGLQCFVGEYYFVFVFFLNSIQITFANQILMRGSIHFRDVFPYGIYMLSYEYAVKALSDSEWVRERRKEIHKKVKKYTYIDVSIPILAGAFAGNSTFPSKKKSLHLILSRRNLLKI